MSQQSRAEADPAGLVDDPRRGRCRALGRVVLVGLLAAAAEMLPLGFASYGGVLLLAWLQQRWDPTWNDGDAWIAAAAGVILVVILVVVAAVTQGIARAGGLPPRATVLIAISASLAAAAVSAALLMAS